MIMGFLIALLLEGRDRQQVTVEGNLKIFFVFFAGSILYFGWITLFLKRREVLDYKRFAEISNEQNKVMELINGMQEIKLHNNLHYHQDYTYNQLLWGLYMN